MKSVTLYITTMQCFQQKRQRWRHFVKHGDFIQSPKTEMFRKRNRNDVSTEIVLIGRLSKSSVFYAVMSAKAS